MRGLASPRGVCLLIDSLVHLIDTSRKLLVATLSFGNNLYWKLQPLLAIYVLY